MGVAPLPTALGDAELDLMRVLGPIPELTRIWRLLMRQHLRHTPRAAASFDFIVSEIETLRPIITGRSDAATTASLFSDSCCGASL
jgi:hypothetical protein